MTFAILALALAYPWLVIHELTHAVTVWIVGGTVTSLRLWPRLDGWHISFGRVDWTAPSHRARYIAGAPLVLDALAVLVCTALGILAGPLWMVGCVLGGADLLRALVVCLAWHRGDLWEAIQ